MAVYGVRQAGKGERWAWKEVTRRIIREKSCNNIFKIGPFFRFFFQKHSDPISCLGTSLYSSLPVYSVHLQSDKHYTDNIGIPDSISLHLLSKTSQAIVKRTNASTRESKEDVTRGSRVAGIRAASKEIQWPRMHHEISGGDLWALTKASWHCIGKWANSSCIDFSVQSWCYYLGRRVISKPDIFKAPREIG